MAGFHPAAGRVIGHSDHDADHSNTHSGNTIDEGDDEIESDFSDFDQPYHETAADWYVRSARRRARRSAGLSSSSSSSSSSDEGSGVESSDNFLEKSSTGSRGPSAGSKRKEREKAVRSAQRPLAKWLASYPLVAARCCLSSTVPADARNDEGNTQFHNSPSPLPAREQETKKMRHIFRRLSRKRKEHRAKFTENNNSALSDLNSSSYYNIANALSLEQMTRINQDDMMTGCDQSAIHSFLPEGTGLSFIDAVLGRSALHSKSALESSRVEQQTLSRLVLELSGPPRSGMTSILLALAARYVASTSNIFLETGCTASSHGHRGGSPTSHPAHDSMKSAGRRQSAFPTVSVNEPCVVILDLEKGIHAVKLILSVREAVLRRWDETAAAREWKRDQEKRAECHGADGETAEERGDAPANTMDEQRQIELAIASCLGRIHLVQPRDFTYLSLVATIEVLRQSLDEERLLRNPVVLPRGRLSPQFGHSNKSSKVPSLHVTKQQEPPTLILIDSLTTLGGSTRFQESLPTTLGSNRSSGNSGLSDRNEFYRQLIRLREEHEITIVGASRSVPSVNHRVNEQASRETSGRKPFPVSINSLWDKMVSHRISLHHAAEGTSEDRAGYTFVATLNANDREGARVFPYSVTAGGIASC